MKKMSVFSRLSVIQKTLLIACIILVGLEIWRPCYFLSDDNMTYWLPFAVEIGRKSIKGESPFTNSYLFNGYSLTRDPNSLLYWNPLTFLLAPLSNSRFYFCLVDAVCIFHLLFCAVSFTTLLASLRKKLDLGLSDNRIVFLSLSFTFSGFALLTGASWLNFLANQAALSLFMLGLSIENRRKGISLITAGVLYTMLAGHLSPFIFTLAFFAIFVAVLGIASKQIEPCFRFVAGVLLGFTLVSPLLFLTLQTFGSSSRSGAFSVMASSASAVNTITLLASFWWGYYGVFGCVMLGIFQAERIQAFASCVASFTLFQELRNLKPLSLSPLEKAILATVAVTTLFIARPDWLGQMLYHLPIFRSLRWPFREIFIWLFLVHLWMGIRAIRWSPRAQRLSSVLGVCTFCISLFTVAPYSFAPMQIDRQLLITGQAEEYWRQIRPHFKAKDQLITIVDPADINEYFDEIPYSLIGAYNYPSLFQVPSVSGYAAQGLWNSKLDGVAPYHWSGVFSPSDGEKLLAAHPHLKALRLMSFHPLRIELRTSTTRRLLKNPELIGDR